MAHISFQIKYNAACLSNYTIPIQLKKLVLYHYPRQLTSDLLAVIFWMLGIASCSLDQFIQSFQKHNKGQCVVLMSDCMFIRKILQSDLLDYGTWAIYTFPFRQSETVHMAFNYKSGFLEKPKIVLILLLKKSFYHFTLIMNFLKISQRPKIFREYL